ncbi:MAG: AAA family ATPase [bacterium]|nr:AAA family ATPase [bacterium]
MEKILNYTLLEKIEETRGSLIYRGGKENEDKTVIIKVFKSASPTRTEIARFRQEYEIIKKIDIDGAIKTHDILEVDGTIALVLEDFDGVSLKKILEEKKIDVTLFLTIAIKLASALGHLHKEKIVHKDIKPHNLLFNAATEELKIADFGISNEITHENNEVYNPDVIEGTLAYMSPEQTGRMNRELDYRTDMYSLGISFYEMLTGSIPFKSKDPMEIIHHHIAIEESPPAEYDPSIPTMISNIVLKLLSKMPEERYQNCFGLMRDLQECQKQLETTGQINEFEPGKNDISPMFTVPHILVGREREINMLISTAGRACSAGQCREMLLVSGNPGTGKSALINEIHRSIMPKRGYFIPGKFDQFRKDVPYSALVQAFRELVTRILSENSEMIEEWKQRLLKALGPNGKVITDVIPEIELVIGEQPAIPELEPEQNQNRFNYVFRSFVGVIAAKDHPVVLFLDDLQWADTASLNVINLLITDRDIQYFLVIGAYRDNEVDESHSLVMTLSAIEDAGVVVNSIHLDILAIEQVNEMVSHFLQCHTRDSQSLAELVHRKTNGNPFFVNQFMKTLYDENLVSLDPARGWLWDVAGIEKLQITDNVVELMARNIAKLSQKTREVLKIGACFGSRFNLENAAEIYERSIEESLDDITPALNNDMLKTADDRYIFQHDRIQEAAYSLVPEEEKERIHYKIGKILLERTPEEHLHDDILTIVDQLNAGRMLIGSEEEKAALAELNLRAGNKAKASAAYKSALVYFQTGITLVQNERGSSRQDQYSLILSLYTESAEAAYLNSDYEAMERFSTEVLDRAQSLADTVKIYETGMRACMAQNKLVEAKNIGINALKQYGIGFPKNPGMVHIVFGLIKLNAALIGKNSETLLSLPLMKDPKMNDVIRLLAGIGGAAYWAEPNLLPLVVFKLIEITIKYGNSSESPYAYCAYGLILCTIGKIDSGYEFGKLGVKLIERMSLKDKKQRVIFLMEGLVRHWKEHQRDTIEALLTGFQMSLEIGDLEFAGHCAVVICGNKYFGALELGSLERELVEYSAILEKINQKTQLQVIKLYHQVVANLLGTDTEPCRVKGNIYDEDEMLPLHTKAHDGAAVASLYLNKCVLCYLFDEYELALDHVRSAEKNLDAMQGTYGYTQFFFYESLIRLALHNTLSWFDRKKNLKRISHNQKKIKKWMGHNPANQSNKFYLVEAERMSVQGRTEEAVRYFKKSIEFARENGFLQEEGIANERAARFWLKNNNQIYAGTHLKAAYGCFDRWGAAAKRAQLEEKYGNLFSKPISMQAALAGGEDSISDSSSYTGITTRSSTETLDLSTVMKAAQAISGEIVLEKLLEKMMTILLENAGAQKGFLILKNETNNALYIEAAGGVNKEIRVLESIPPENTDALSIAIVNYVHKSKKNVVLHNASEEGRFTGDPYVEKNRPKSIICVPIIHKGEISGLIYLENNLTTNAFTPERVELLRLLSSQAAISIENARLVAHREDSAKLKKEMEIAANIQTGLLPRNPEIKDYEISAYLKPADDVGGDYYDIINVEDRDWIVIGDVAGHGVPAGLIMMMVQTAIHTVITQHPNLSPAELLMIINKVIKKNIVRLNEDKYMTITVFAAHENGEFIFSGLHRDILIFRAQSNTVEPVKTQGMWIGMFYDIDESLKNDSFFLNPGDTMLVCTDGITEAWRKGSIKNNRDPKTDMFGEKKLTDDFSRLGKGPLEEIKNGILAELEEYQCTDDVTLVLLRRLP